MMRRLACCTRLPSLPHLLPRITARLAAPARLLLPAEGTAWPGTATRTVYVSNHCGALICARPCCPSVVASHLPISAPLVPMLTLTMPQSEPSGPDHLKMDDGLDVNSADDRPCGNRDTPI